MALFGGADMSTIEGYFQTETLGMMTPIAVILVANAAAAGGIAGLERNRTIGVLLANPIPRWRIVLAALASSATWTLIVAVTTGGGIAVSNLLFDLGMDYGNIAAVTLMAFALGWFFGGLALLISAATGRTAVTSWTTVAVAVVTYFLNVFLTLDKDLKDWAQLSPFYWYGENQPLINGLEWSHAAVLLAGGAVLAIAAFFAYRNRDLRLGT
ncbi:MAG: ABC transporter permease [Actinomycetales bacterium]|nr:MAG: ABC transporter permease [Actinomycetales bacterium]